MVERPTAGRGAKLGLLFGSILVLLGIGEVTARSLHALRLAAGIAGVPNAHELSEIDGLFDLVQNNVRAIHRGVYYRTNDRGLRGPSYSRTPAPGTFRILIAGDSVTMGSGVREEAAYPAVLERLLNAGDASPRRYEIVNLGVSGVNAEWVNTRLVRLGDYYHADLVVYGFTLNDIEGPNYEHPRKSEEAATAAAVWKRVNRFQDSPSYMLRELWPRWIAVLEWDAFHVDVMGNESDVWHRNYFENPPAWQDFADVLARLSQYANGRGICGQVFIHTYLARLDEEHAFEVFYRKVEDEARARGLGVTQSLPALSGRDASSLWVSRWDSHPNAQGHALMAGALYEGLQHMPSACWRTTAERAADPLGTVSPAGSRSSAVAR